MPIQVRWDPKVPVERRVEIRAAVRALEYEVAIPHRVKLLVVRGDRFFTRNADGSIDPIETFGLFSGQRHSRSRRMRPEITLAAGGDRRSRRWYARYGIRHRAGGHTPVVVTLAHELVHYEQWRDGAMPHHRGIRGRAVALARRALKRMKESR